jgi:hypothetical protein
LADSPLRNPAIRVDEYDRIGRLPHHVTKTEIQREPFPSPASFRSGDDFGTGGCRLLLRAIGTVICDYQQAILGSHLTPDSRNRPGNSACFIVGRNKNRDLRPGDWRGLRTIEPGNRTRHLRQ